jgi:hypothetical protein
LEFVTMIDYSHAITNGNGRKPPSGLDAFDSAQAAPEFVPIPPGTYSARVLKGEHCTTKAGDDAYRLRFEVTTEGEHVGKTVIRTWTFGPRAIGYTKRDLTPFGLTTAAKLMQPFPEPGREYVLRLVVALQRGDDGIERNEVRRIDVLRVDESQAAQFMLPQGEGGSK